MLDSDEEDRQRATFDVTYITSHKLDEGCAETGRMLLRLISSKDSNTELATDLKPYSGRRVP